MGFVLFPTFTYNKIYNNKTKSYDFIYEDIYKKYMNRKCEEGKFINKENKFFYENKSKDSDGNDVIYQRYVIFFEPNDNYLEIVKKNNAKPGGKYIKGILNPTDLINFVNTINK